MLNLFHIDQPNIRVVHQRGGLERLAWPLVRQPGSRELSQLVIHEREELIGGRGITRFDLRQDSRDIVHDAHDYTLANTNSMRSHPIPDVAPALSVRNLR